MGVSVGVTVRVGTLLGLGETVHVGDVVLVAVKVEILVSLGVSVQVGEGFGVICLLQAASQQAITNKLSKKFLFLLWGDGEKRVMIIDFSMRNPKGVISIADVPLG